MLLVDERRPCYLVTITYHASLTPMRVHKHVVTHLIVTPMRPRHNDLSYGWHPCRVHKHVVTHLASSQWCTTTEAPVGSSNGFRIVCECTGAPASPFESVTNRFEHAILASDCAWLACIEDFASVRSSIAPGESINRDLVECPGRPANQHTGRVTSVECAMIPLLALSSVHRSHAQRGCLAGSIARPLG